jgi:hypothetical protein
MRKILLGFICFFFISTFSFSQSQEGYLFEITAMVKLYLPQNDMANLQGTERYIRVGISGYQKDMDELVGYMNRYTINDHQMITRVGAVAWDSPVVYYTFYLDPLYDANNFQQMLESFKVTQYFTGAEEKPISSFSNTIYAFIKSKKI